MTARAAQEALAAGDLAGCRAHLVAAVKAAPGDPALRAFLFQFACVTGDWPRALGQLDALAQVQPDALDMVGDYRAAIVAEARRDDVFAGRAAPIPFGGAKPWIDDMAAALRAEAAGQAAEAADLRARALEAAPARPGTANEARFAWFADADGRIGPALEAVMNGAYRWIALEDLSRLDVTPPRDLRDAVWTVAVATFADGGEWPVMIPTRYPGTHATSDASLALARRTEWREAPGGAAIGLGQRIFAHDGGDVALMDLRTLAFDTAPAG